MNPDPTSTVHGSSASAAAPTAGATDVAVRAGAADRVPVTVVVPVRNEEGTLAACLSRLAAFAEVVVVDSRSTDRTVEIARSLGATVVDFAWNGRFPKKRNWLLSTFRFTTPWVLFLDADEHMTEAFVATLRRVLATTRHDGFWISYDNYFQGRRLRHGVPQRKLALFKAAAGRYERIDEVRWSHLDMEVHEHPIIGGSVGDIADALEHKDDRGLEHFIGRHNAYSSWEAQRSVTLGGEGSSDLTPRQRLKYQSIEKWWFSPAYFIMTYVFRRGFLDGRAGFVYAVMKAIYFFEVREKIREARARAEERGDNA